MMKNKQVIIAISAVIVAVLLGAGVYFLTSKQAAPKPVTTQQGDTVVLTLKPEDIGMTLTPITSGKFAGNGLTLTITKITDIASIDYELSYTSKGDIPRGAIGHVDIKPVLGVFTQDLPFGTCSDKCHFDEAVSNVKMTVKVSKSDGKVYSVEQTYTAQ